MATEHEKGKIELEVFNRFAKVAGLNVTSVEKQLPEGGIPDLKCIIDNEIVYFELAEACSEDIAKALATAEDKNDPIYVEIRNYSTDIYKKKIRKTYSVSEPVELLIYNAGRSILPDEVILENMQRSARYDKGQFRKIWYFGEHAEEI
jgi:hypothetical protein